MTQLRDHVGRALYEEPNTDADWAALSDERREPWRKDADRIIPIIAAEYAAITAEKFRAMEACEQMGRRITAMQAALAAFIEAIDAGRPPHLEDYDRARNLIAA
jgi:hypothetical protein